jgi:hypothetical protein
MTLRFLVAALFASAVAFAPAASRAFPDPPLDADVLIQAGHEGRPDCDREPATLCTRTGTPGEMELNARVADAVAQRLRKAGFRVLRRPAYLPRFYRVRDAVFIHFDGSASPCASGASVGYPEVADSQAAAAQWKALYGLVWRFGFEPDNFTTGLRDYYGYKHVAVSDAALTVEFGELTCPRQAEWLRSHLRTEVSALSRFLEGRLRERGATH